MEGCAAVPTSYTIIWPWYKCNNSLSVSDEKVDMMFAFFAVKIIVAAGIALWRTVHTIRHCSPGLTQHISPCRAAFLRIVERQKPLRKISLNLKDKNTNNYWISFNTKHDYWTKFCCQVIETKQRWSDFLSPDSILVEFATGFQFNS